MVILEIFADYYDPQRPKRDKITITPVDGNEPQAATPEAGDVQYVGGTPSLTLIIERTGGNPDISVDLKPVPGFPSVWITPWRDDIRAEDLNKPLDELKQENGFEVRLALVNALDCDLVITQGLFGLSAVAHGCIIPAKGVYFGETPAGTSEQARDAEDAKQLRADAGCPNGDGFPTLKLHTTPTPRHDDLVVVNIRKQVTVVNVDVASKDLSVGIAEFKMNVDLRLDGSGGDYDPDDGLVD